MDNRGQLVDMISNMDDKRKPFSERRFGSCLLRVFNPNAPSHLFKWHSDDLDRELKVVNDTDWQFQFDNEHPFEMTQGQKILVRKGVQHRLIQGSGRLWIRITEQG